MLKDYKNIYKEVADRVPGWNKIPKNDLIRKYIEYKDSNKYIAEGYVSAVILKYWGTLNSYSRKSSSNGRIYPDDHYNWLINAITYTLNKHVWDEPYIDKILKTTGEHKHKKNPLYGDPNGPDKALNRCIYSMRMAFYQESNYDIRRLNYDVLSLDQLVEDSNCDYNLPSEYQDDINSFEHMHIKNIITNYFKSKDYYNAFILEGIINGDIFDNKDISQSFNKKKLTKHLKNLNDNYCQIISNTYQVPLNEIIEASKIYKNLKSIEIHNIIDNTIEGLKQPEFRMELLA